LSGVVQQLKAILAELDLLMAIDGYPTVQDLRTAGVRRA
jgi:lactate 2-monooxygenase